MTPPTGSLQSPSPTQDTPAPIPYRLDTSAVLVVHQPIPTAQLVAIRQAWQPTHRGWWQFDLKPFHYWTAIGSAFVLFITLVVVLATHGTIR